jgi:hypothetical protein
MANRILSRRDVVFAAALLAAAMIASSGRLLAQSSPPAPGCAYDQCALRVEGNRILRGASGESVGSLGVFSATNLTGLVSGVLSDSATAHARIFDATYGRGSTLALVGALVAGAALGVEHSRRDQRLTGGTSTVFAIAVSGMVAGLVGVREVAKAHDALSRAIWWHNRELPR